MRPAAQLSLNNRLASLVNAAIVLADAQHRDTWPQVGYVDDAPQAEKDRVHAAREKSRQAVKDAAREVSAQQREVKAFVEGLLAGAGAE